MKALIVAGETSGDIYGGRLAAALRDRARGVQLAGMGGDRMQQAGVDLLHHNRSVAVVGVFEVVSKLRQLSAAYRKIVHWIDTNSPDFAILIDFPDFNFRLAKYLKKKGIRTFYFISPQIWAWRKGRIDFLKDHIIKMITILPFEKKLYDLHGVPAVYVGHPLVEIVQQDLATQSFPCNKERSTIGIMPGSRDVEVRRHLPVLLETLKILRKQRELEVLLIRAPSLSGELYRDVPDNVQVISDNRYAAMACCDFLLVASGTSTLEAAILNVPFLIVYRVGSISWNLGKLLVRVPYYGLVNWIAQRKIVPEFIQEQMTPAQLAGVTLSYLDDSRKREAMKEELQTVVQSLGSPGAIERAAAEILSSL